MNKELAAKLDPKTKSDAERQQVLEQLVYNRKKPDQEIWKTIIPLIGQEPVVWIQGLEIRLLKRLPFQVDFIQSAFSLLDAPQASLRLEGAGLIREVLDRLKSQKDHEAVSAFESGLLKSLLSALARQEIIAQQSVWLELYLALSNLSAAPAVSDAMVNLLPKDCNKSLHIFAQYVQGKHSENCLGTVLAGCTQTSSEDTLQHLVRALGLKISKKGAITGYTSTEPIITSLLGALKSKSENVRREVCSVFASRGKAAVITKTPLPLEAEVWNGVFNIYAQRLASPVARDKDEANMAIAALPITNERLTRLFEVMHSVTDGMDKQNVVGLIGSFKMESSRSELLRLLRENFAGLRLEEQKITVNSVSKYLPDEEIEVELDKLISGKGLHSDVLSSLGDKLFSPIPSLKTRLMKWLGLNEKTKRPLLEQFQLPMMHTKILQSARRLSDDSEILEKLLILEPLLMMNDAKTKLHEILKAFPGVRK